MLVQVLDGLLAHDGKIAAQRGSEKTTRASPESGAARQRAGRCRAGTCRCGTKSWGSRDGRPPSSRAASPRARAQASGAPARRSAPAQPARAAASLADAGERDAYEQSPEHRNDRVIVDERHPEPREHDHGQRQQQRGEALDHEAASTEGAKRATTSSFGSFHSWARSRSAATSISAAAAGIRDGVGCRARATMYENSSRLRQNVHRSGRTAVSLRFSVACREASSPHLLLGVLALGAFVLLTRGGSKRTPSSPA